MIPSKAPYRPANRWTETFVVAALIVLLSVLAALWFFRQGYILYFGDAEAHLNIARRILDSRTPGFDQVGTAWLPLPHLLMVGFVWDDWLWRTGLAGTIPSAAAFVAACCFLYAALRRLFVSRAPVVAGVAVFALNPNVLYLQSIPMNECLFFLALAGMLYSTVLFAQTGRPGSVVLAAVFSNVASTSRYEGWFLIPFLTLFFAVQAGWRKWWIPIGFGALASIGPLFWLGFNWWHYSNPIEFYNGPYSAKAIYERALKPGQRRFPGDHHPLIAARYLFAAARWCAGWPLVIIGTAGIAAALWKRKLWLVGFLILPGVFYVMSMYSAGAVIHVPGLWPNTWYNIRYGSTLLMLLAAGTAALAAIIPLRAQPAAAIVLVLLSIAPWLVHPEPDSWLLWKESEMNSIVRREWTAEGAAFFRTAYRRGDGVFAPFGDLTGIFRSSGIPLRETLHEGNNPSWAAAEKRPDLFLSAKWAVAFENDAAAAAIARANQSGTVYRRVDRIVVRGADPVDIYRRVGPLDLMLEEKSEGSVHQSARR